MTNLTILKPSNPRFLTFPASLWQIFWQPLGHFLTALPGFIIQGTILVVTLVANLPANADDYYFTYNEDNSPVSIDLRDYFAEVTWSVFHSSNNNSTLLQTSHSDWAGCMITLTFQPNQSGSAVINTWADSTLPSNVYLHITVNSVNDAPVANNGNFTINEDTVLSNFLSASDLEGNSLIYRLVTNGTKGNATITNFNTGAFTYIPLANENSTDSFTFKVNDGSANSNTATVTIIITPVNDAPVANDASFTTNEDTTLTGSLTASDVEGSALTYSLVTNGTKGSATITDASSGAFTYTSTANLNGTDSFTFQVNDGTVDSNIATIIFTVTPVNDAPSFTANNPPVVLENTGIHLLTGWATFNPGPNETDNLLTYTVSEVSNPGLFSHWPNVDTNGALTYQSAINQSGTSTFTVTVQDTGGTANGGVDRSVPQNFTLTVIAPEINVQQGGVNLPNGESFDFGNIGIGSTLTKSFLIENQGTFELLLNNSPPIVVLNNQAGEFSVDETSTLSFLAVGGKTTFTLSVTPSQLGTKSVTVVIPNTDSDESSYRFNVTATSVPAQLLKIFLAGPGSGHITSDQIGMDCTTEPNICTLAVINPPRWIDLTATPDPGFKFTGWSGEEACQATGKVFVMANTACVATFELQSYELSVGRLGQGQVKGPGLDCPPECTETFLYGTEIQLEAVADREWIHTGWKGSCDQTGKVKLTNALLCQAIFQEDPTVPNQLDGNGDGIPDARQPNVISLPDKVTGRYVTRRPTGDLRD